MPINFILNDPLASSLSTPRKQAPRSDRPSARAGFQIDDLVPEDVFDVGTEPFVQWQSREAALWAVETWEGIAGNITEWARSHPRKTLKLIPIAGSQLNAYYDGEGVEFFRAQSGGKTTYSGASTDVVAHEVGHACLDVLRPDLWDANTSEASALHESVADCVAILTALSDDETRRTLLAGGGTLDNPNFVESVMEDLADGVRRKLGKDHPAAEPRQALNTFQWQLPTTLPTTGKPSVLTSEFHSFSRVFTGCFYDLIRNLFSAQSTKNAAGLWTAAETAGQMLVAGLRQAPITARMFQAVGRAMVLADTADNGGANRDAIRKAFEAHGIALGSAAMLAPTAALEGTIRKRAMAASRAALPRSTRDDLRRRLGAQPGARLSVSPVTIGDRLVLQAVHVREVPLSGISEELEGVVALSPEPVLVGAEGGRAAILGAMPESTATEDEVRHFAATLVTHGAISTARGRRGAVAAAGDDAQDGAVTHVIRQRGGRKVLERVRFACRHCG